MNTLDNIQSSDFLRVSNIYKSFSTQSYVLSDVSFSLSLQEKVGIVGESGSGKSVLLKLIGGVEEADSGIISWSEGQVPAIGFLFQEGALFDSLSVEENVMFPLVSARSRVAGSELSETPPCSVSEARDKAGEMLRFVGLSEARYKLPSELSGGMRKRVGIARSLVHAPQILLLDDPTSGLDPITANTIMNLIERLADERKCSVIMVSHDIRRLIPRVDRILMLSRGRIIADCSIKEILDSSTRNRAPREMISFLETRFDFQNAG
ncbi:MAG TPA: ATP-binding cassette domain-containing protein [Oligoflexia bacterium]|nr:ATP-binding cassette domain-containing protein [Oligoflexia bacterium]HMP48411.1 ATP-binding cassette domain-containing protein [Oligoflexia bacterium]